MRVWDAMLENLVLVHIVLPGLILALVGVFRFRGIGAVRFIVLQGCLLWVACGIAILMRFNPAALSPDSLAFSQFVTSAYWRLLPAGPGIRLSIGVDGLSLWYLVTLPWIVLSLVFWESMRKHWTIRDFACLITANAGIVLAIAARDLLVLAISTSIIFLSVVLWSRSQLRTAGPRAPSVAGLVTWGIAVGALFLFGAAAAVVASVQVQEQNRVANPAISTGIDDLVFGLPSIADDSERAHLAWRQQAGAIYLVWCAAALACVGAWPLQELLVRTLKSLDLGLRIVVVSGMMPLGAYIVVRFCVPLLGEFIDGGLGWAVWPVIVSLFWHLAMLTQVDAPQEGMLRLTMSAQLLALIGGMTGTPSGICGAIILSLTSGWAYAAWCLSGSNDEAASLHPAQWLALLFLAGCPGGGVFSGLCMIGASILLGAQQGVMSGIVLLATLGLLWLLLVGSVFRIARAAQVTSSPRIDARPLSYAGGYCLLAAILLSGLLSGRAVNQSSHAAHFVSGQLPDTSPRAAE